MAQLPRLLIPYDSSTFGAHGVSLIGQVAAHVPVIVVVRDHDLSREARVDTCQSLVEVLSSSQHGEMSEESTSWCVVGLRSVEDIEADWPVQVAGWHLAAALLDRSRQDFGARPVVGASCHNRQELRLAERCNVRYATLSPFFPSLSKPGYSPTFSMPELATLIGETATPVFALGGVTPSNAAQCRLAGAYGVAAVGCLADSLNPAMTAQEFIGEL